MLPWPRPLLPLPHNVAVSRPSLPAHPLCQVCVCVYVCVCLLPACAQNPYYLRVASNIQSTLHAHNRVQCGYTQINHVDTGESLRGTCRERVVGVWGCCGPTTCLSPFSLSSPLWRF